MNYNPNPMKAQFLLLFNVNLSQPQLNSTSTQFQLIFDSTSSQPQSQYQLQLNLNLNFTSTSTQYGCDIKATQSCKSLSLCWQQLIYSYIRYENGRKKAGTILATSYSSSLNSLTLHFDLLWLQRAPSKTPCS